MTPMLWLFPAVVVPLFLPSLSLRSSAVVSTCLLHIAEPLSFINETLSSDDSSSFKSKNDVESE